MFNYSSSDAVIPSLVFTKAELVYAISVLTANISPDDNSTGIEMVEIRHYLNLIKDRVALAASDGTLRKVVVATADETGNDTKSGGGIALAPSMDELRLMFPHLSNDEIREVLSNVADEREEAEEKKINVSTYRLPPSPSFIARQGEMEKPETMTAPMTKKQMTDKENSRKFCNMLGDG